MQILRRDDPRDKLEKATRDELVDFAHINGQMDISEQMPKTVIVEMLRSRGLTNISIPERVLGEYVHRDQYGILDRAPAPPQEKTKPAASSDPDKMSIQELRAECRRLKIKLERTDNIPRLREKLRGQAAS